jgi:putative sterol carrier protein
MISIQKPKDLLSVSLVNILSYRKDDEFVELVRDWNKKILIEIEKFYPVLVIFKDSSINFKFRDVNQKPDLQIKMALNTLLDIAYGRLSSIKAILSRKLKIKGLLKINTLLKFKKIFLDTMIMIAADPNEKYYLLNQNTM